MEQNLLDTISRISGVNPRKCMRCGKCTASCPAFDEMDYHPHQFVSMVENGRIDELLRSRGIYLCLSCASGGDPAAGRKPSAGRKDSAAARR